MIHLAEGKSMVDTQYARGFTDALELSLKVFDRLILKESLKKECDTNCPIVVQIRKLLLFSKEKQFEKIQAELGFFVP